MCETQDHEVAEQYMSDHAGYEKKARQWVTQYAQEGYVTEKEKLVVLLRGINCRFRNGWQLARMKIMFIVLDLCKVS